MEGEEREKISSLPESKGSSILSYMEGSPDEWSQILLLIAVSCQASSECKERGGRKAGGLAGLDMDSLGTEEDWRSRPGERVLGPPVFI